MHYMCVGIFYTLALSIILICRLIMECDARQYRHSVEGPIGESTKEQPVVDTDICIQIEVYHVPCACLHSTPHVALSALLINLLSSSNIVQCE